MSDDETQGCSNGSEMDGIRRASSQHPVFVVGVPRSGTTLLAAMLAGHSRMSCGTETRFYHFLARTSRGAVLESWPDRAIEFLFSLRLDNRVADDYRITRSEALSFLNVGERSIARLLSCLTETRALREGKARWMEKSPEHLAHVDEIRRDFPESPIVRIIRDPRDVAVSMTKVPFAPSDFLDALMLCRRYIDKSEEFFKKDARCYTVRFESLALDTEGELSRLCAFLGESFEPGMLATWRKAKSLATEAETWKKLVWEPVQRDRVRVWKRELSRDQNLVAEALVGDRLLEYGYETVETFQQEAEVMPRVGRMLEHRHALLSLAKEGTRFWSAASGGSRRAFVYIGDPDAEVWIRHEKPWRYLDACGAATTLLWRAIVTRRVLWLRSGRVGIGRSVMGRLLSRGLTILRKMRLADIVHDPCEDAQVAAVPERSSGRASTD